MKISYVIEKYLEANVITLGDYLTYLCGPALPVIYPIGRMRT